MKIATIIGARPQFIKAATVSRAILEHNKKSSDKLEEIIIHTGQHFDEKMSDIFFDEMEIPKPNYFLGIHGLSHGAMTGEMLKLVEEVLQKEKPQLVLVYGDTNTTLAGALASVKIHIPVAHVEAGLRSFNINMPEEVNRILTDRISTILFCPTDKAVDNLKKEGYPNRLSKDMYQEICKIGDVMYDAAIFYSKKATDFSILEKRYRIKDKDYILCTIHRAENTDDKGRLENILLALSDISKEIDVVIPLHPRTKHVILKDEKLQKLTSTLKITEPVGYFDMLALLKHAKLVMTDSGGLQKEAFFFGKFCITLRDETEWTELVEANVNFLSGASFDKITKIYKEIRDKKFNSSIKLYGNGDAANKVVEKILSYGS